MSISYIHILVIFIIKPLCLIRFQMRNKLIVSKKLLLINSKYLVWFSHLPDAGNGQKVVRIKVRSSPLPTLYLFDFFQYFNTLCYFLSRF